MELTKKEKEILYGLVHDHYEELYKGETKWTTNSLKNFTRKL